MKIFDIHCHAFPDIVAPKIIESLESFYGFPWERTGTYPDLMASLDEAGVERAVIFSCATRPDQVRNINDYIASKTSERLIGFGTLHPDFRDFRQELNRMRSLGLRGIKFHPDFQRFDFDDRTMYPLFEAIPPDMPVMVHAGDPKLDFSAPRRIAHVAALFPHLTLVAAHMGGFGVWDEAERLLIGQNLWLDVSSTIGHLSAERVERLARAHGLDRVLFGSDYPSVSHAHAIAAVQTMNLSELESEALFWKNACRLLALPE